MDGPSDGGQEGGPAADVFLYREPVNNVADMKCFRFYVHILFVFLVFTLHPSQINCAVKPSFTHAQLHSWAFLMELCLHADTSRLTQVSHENSALALITN